MKMTTARDTRLAAGVLLAAVAVLLASSPASAQSPPPPDDEPRRGDERERSYTAETGPSYLTIAADASGWLGSGDGGGGGASRCLITEVIADTEAFRNTYLADPEMIPLQARVYYVNCGERDMLRWYIPGQTDPVESGMLTEFVQEAFDQIWVDEPAMLVTPSPDNYQLTGLPTWLAIDEAAFTTVTGQVSVPQLTVLAWIEPLEVVWDMGDGHIEVCDNPGNVYDQGVSYHQQQPWCSYTYTHIPADLTGDADASSYPLSATVVYRAGYQVTFLGYEDTFDLGTIDGPTVTAAMTVRELRPMLCADLDCSNVDLDS